MKAKAMNPSQFHVYSSITARNMSPRNIHKLAKDYIQGDKRKL